MAKSRSPGFPSVGLKEAIDKVTLVYNEDYQNPVSRAVAAGHMGYKGISGTSLTMLSTLLKYNLLEGRGENTRVSDLAVTIIAHPPGTPERLEALKEAATEPNLFVELDLRFNGGNASDQAIRSYLLTQKFTPPAAETAVRAYRETKQFIASEDTMSPQAVAEAPVQTVKDQEPAVLGKNRFVWPLPEGEAAFTLPSALSKASADELLAWMDVIIGKVRREIKPGEK